MKLTSSQLETIETYLLSWELQFRDFYDEMFDHFCTEIEQRLSGGISFDNALAETSYLFDGHKFRATKVAHEYRGIKAYEMEWLDKHSSKNNALFLSEAKRQILSPNLIVWVLICLGVYQSSVYFELPKLWAFVFIPAAIFLMTFTQMKILSWMKLTWKQMLSAFTYKNAGVHKTKETLFGKPHTLLYTTNRYGLLFVLFLYAPHLFIRTESVALLIGITYGVLFLFAVYIFNKVTDEIIRQEREKINVFPLAN